MLVFVCITGAIHFRCIDYECCHDTSVVTAQVDHVVGFSILTVFQVSSLDQDVVDLFLGPYKRSVIRFFSVSLSPGHGWRSAESLVGRQVICTRKIGSVGAKGWCRGAWVAS